MQGGRHDKRLSKSARDSARATRGAVQKAVEKPLPKGLENPSHKGTDSDEDDWFAAAHFGLLQ